MTTVLALIAGACYSAAYISPKPYCFIALAVSSILVVLMRI
jgi:hypothetical protein